MLVTAQNVPALETAHGEKEARVLLGTCQTKGFLKVTSDPTAKFASDALREQEVYQHTISVANGGGGRTVTRNQATVRRPVVLPDEVKALPLPDWAGGVVSGYFAPAGVGPYRADVNFRDDAPPPPPGPPVPDYQPRPPDDQVLRPFERRDLARLGIPDTPITRKVYGVTDPPPPPAGGRPQ